MQRFIRTISATLGAVTAALVFSGFANANAQARSGSDDPKIEVSYTDLDLSRHDHAVELYTRIERAARSLCHVDTGPYTRARKLEQQCMTKAVDGAVQKVGNTNLTAVYAAKQGKHSMVASSR